MTACEATTNLGFNEEDAAAPVGPDGGDVGRDGGEAPDTSAPPSDGGAPTDGGGDAASYPFGYPCDPIVNEGCGADAFCLLRWPDDGGRADVACVPRTSSCGDRVGSTHPLCAFEDPPGTFWRGGVCSERGSSARCGQAACDLTAAPDTPRGCPSNRVCEPIGDAGVRRQGYGHCERYIQGGPAGVRLAGQPPDQPGLHTVTIVRGFRPSRNACAWPGPCLYHGPDPRRRARPDRERRAPAQAVEDPMKKLSWMTGPVIVALATANFLFAGCGSDVAEDGADASADGTTDGANPDPNPNPTPNPNPGDGAADDGAAGDSGLDGAQVGDAGVDPRDGATCRLVGQDCASSADCCSTNCDTATKKCEAPTGLCKAPGAACATGNECCTYNCVNGTCGSKLCISDNQGCANNADCCSGTCGANGFCTPLNPSCKTGGNTCAANTECCSKFCNNGVCSTQVSFCTQTGDVCSSDFECCGGTCRKAAGANVGTCGVVTAPGATGCAPSGTVCGASVAGGAPPVYDGGALPPCGGECCSRSCAPYGPSGVLVCQPPSGCRPTGELCEGDSDCCGHAGAPPVVNGPVTCVKAAGQRYGRCNNGGSCREAGSICKPADYACNAENNCCEGVDHAGPGNCNNNPGNCCERDALGIPRCLITSKRKDCTNPAAFDGMACASSADCCGNPCIANVCNPANVCIQKGGSCTSNADCCPGLPCVAPPGSTRGVCGGVLTQDGGVSDAGPDPVDGGPGGDAGGDGGAGEVCALYGQTCNPASNACCNALPCLQDRAGTYRCLVP